MSDFSRIFTNSDSIRDFVLAGNSIFTVTSPTGTSFTFKVKLADPRPGMSSTWFVGVLTGPDNTSSYTYLGFLRDNQYIPGKKIGQDAPSQKVAIWLMPRLIAGQLPSQVEFRTSGRCGRCGRLLTTPESIDRGIGPECWNKMHEGM